MNAVELLLSCLGITKITSIICLILSRKTDIDNEKKLINATNSPTTPTDYILKKKLNTYKSIIKLYLELIHMSVEMYV